MGSENRTHACGVAGIATFAREVGLAYASGGLSLLGRTGSILLRVGLFGREVYEGTTNAYAGTQALMDGKPLTAAYHYGLTVLNLFGMKNAKGALDDAAEVLAPVFKNPQTVATTIRDSAMSAARMANNALERLGHTLRLHSCFTPDTVVATPNGPRPIGDIKAGDLVLSYNHDTATWVPCRVEIKHENEYIGPLHTITTTGGTIRTTIGHPFWVIEGGDLRDRPTPKKLLGWNDEHSGHDGRWVNSHDLWAGDLLLGDRGQTRRVLKTEQEFCQTAVCELTVEGDHNYAVGPDAVLVHNSNGGSRWIWQREGIDTPSQKLRDMVREQGGFVDPETNLWTAFDGPLAADHIYPKSRLEQLPGFSNLSRDQQEFLYNYPGNFQPLPLPWNSSKKDLLADEWTMTPMGQLASSQYIDNLREQQEAFKAFAQNLIHFWLRP